MFKNLLKKSALPLASLMLIFVMASCDKPGDAVAATDYSDYYSSVFSVNEPLTDVTDCFIPASEVDLFGEMPMPVGPGKDCNLGDKKLPPNDKGDKNLPKDGKDIRNPFARVFMLLNLTEEQKVQVREFMIAHRQCEKDAILALREAQRPIIEAANAQRKEIMAKLKSGEITRREAGDLLKILNQTVREQLKNDPAVEAAHQALKACWDIMLDNIGSVLTEEQLVKWTKFLEMKKK